jgi:phytoene/squalene synthetase
MCWSIDRMHHSKHDYEHYLCGLLYPTAVRDGYWALRAFFIELSAVREAVNDPRIGQMRLQFWRDTIDQVFKVCTIKGCPLMKKNLC